MTEMGKNMGETSLRAGLLGSHERSRPKSSIGITNYLYNDEDD